MRTVPALLVLAAALLPTSFAFASHDEPTCAEVRKVRAFAASRGIDQTGLAAIERERCDPGGDIPPSRPRWDRREDRQSLNAPISDSEFEQYVLRPINSASRSAEPSVCRSVSRQAFFTSEQVRRVMGAVGRANEAACAIAFYPSVVDKLRWETVYAPMGSESEKQVRRAIDEGL